MEPMSERKHAGIGRVLVAVYAVLAFLLVESLELWEETMQTLAVVLLAAAIATAIAIPLGILSARNRGVRLVVRPVLDFMQTMPAFVYLVPGVVFFGLGVVPGTIITIIFALPPGVRLTELGIRQVDRETVEAGQALVALARGRQVVAVVSLAAHDHLPSLVGQLSPGTSLDDVVGPRTPLTSDQPSPTRSGPAVAGR